MGTGLAVSTFLNDKGHCGMVMTLREKKSDRGKGPPPSKWQGAIAHKVKEFTAKGEKAF